MGNDPKNYDYATFVGSATGSHDEPQDFKVLVVPFGRYNINIRLSENNEFRGIEAIEVNKDFLTHKQRTTPKGFHDVNEFYKE